MTRNKNKTHEAEERGGGALWSTHISKHHTPPTTTEVRVYLSLTGVPLSIPPPATVHLGDNKLADTRPILQSLILAIIFSRSSSASNTFNTN